MDLSLKLCLSALICIACGFFQQPVSGLDLPPGFPSFPFLPESIFPRSLNVGGKYNELEGVSFERIEKSH